jgi:hypothetical protein
MQVNKIWPPDGGFPYRFFIMLPPISFNAEFYLHSSSLNFECVNNATHISLTLYVKRFYCIFPHSVAHMIAHKAVVQPVHSLISLPMGCWLKVYFLMLFTIIPHFFLNC